MAKLNITDPCFKFPKVIGCHCTKCQWRSMCKKCNGCVSGSNLVDKCPDRKEIKTSSK
jgi:hypothetical protein